MAFLGKTYTLSGHENLVPFFKAAGYDEDRVKRFVDIKPSVKFVKNGDQYVVTNGSIKGSKDSTFTPGVEIDDTIGSENIPIKTTYTIDGNTIIQELKTPKGNAVFKRIFDGDDLTVLITSEIFDGVSKTFYKA